MMELPVLFVFSHDFIGIGTNGPNCMSRWNISPRCAPFRICLCCARPTQWRGRSAGKSRSAIGSAQPRSSSRARSSNRRGGMRARRTAPRAAVTCSRTRKVVSGAPTIFATGSEVAIALKARAILQAEGVPTAVISMPSWELFERQDAAYRQEVIGRGTGSGRGGGGGAARLGPLYRRAGGGFVGMSSFGASGAEEALFKHFGITPEAVANAVRQLL